MRVVARSVESSEYPTALAKRTPLEQVFLKTGAEYEVFALAVFEGRLGLQIIDDLGYLSWEPAWFFDVVDGSIPEDWICSFFREEPLLIVGPPFVARDTASYASMVQLESDAVNQFWARVRSVYPHGTED